MADNPETISQRLDSMTTRWSLVQRAHQASIVSAGQARNELVLRYSSAIRSYVRAILQDDTRADELAQDAVVRLLSGDFAGADPNRGRFRDLLKVSVRNMARNHWEKENRRRPAAVDVDEIAGAAESSEDSAWLSSWRQNALDLTWSALESFERSQPGSSAVATPSPPRGIPRQAPRNWPSDWRRKRANRSRPRRCGSSSGGPASNLPNS